MNSLYKKSIDYIKANFVSLLAIFIFCICFIFYVLYDNTPPHWDGGRHYYDMFNYWETFKHIFTSTKENGHTDAINRFVTGYYFYPPGYSWVSLPFFALFGRVYSVAIFSNIFWILLLSFSWIGWVKNLNFQKNSISLGLFVLLGSPFLIGQTRETMIDIPCIATIFFVLYTYESLNKSFSTKNILLTSFAIALSLMVKWSSITYLPVITIIYLIRIINLNKEKIKSKNLPVFSLLYSIFTSVFAIAGTWYIPNLTRLKLDLTLNSSTAGIKEGDPQGVTWESFKFYLSVIVNDYLWLSWVLFITIIFVITMIHLHRNKKLPSIIKDKKYNNIKFVILLSVITFITIMLYYLNQSNKDARYVVIFYVSIAGILSSLYETLMLSEFKIKWLKTLHTLGLTIFLLNTLNLTLPLGSFNYILFKNSDFPVTVIGNSGYTNPRSQRKNWAIYEALKLAGEIRYSYVYKNDSCVSKDYWNPKPTIGIDFDSMPLHSNFGTVWGLSEQYGLEMGSISNACFIIVAENTKISEINTDKYEKDYKNIGSFEDWQGFNMVLLQKR